MDLRVQFPDPTGYRNWQDWATELNQVLSRMITPTPSDQYPIVILRDVKPSNTPGGTFTALAWQIRDLNDEYDPVNICLLANNTFQIPKGRYAVRASAPALAVNQHKTRLWNVTDGVIALNGSSEFAGPGPAQSRSWCVGVIEPKQATTYRLEHGCQATRPTDGCGVPTAPASGVEVYSQVELWGLT